MPLLSKEKSNQNLKPQPKGANPFLLEKPISVIVARELKDYVHESPDDSTANDNLNVSNKFIADQHHSTKLYRVAGFEDQLFELSPNALKLFIYICFHVRKKQDYIEMKPSKILEKLNVSKKTYYKARQELIDREIISSKTSRQNMYWINPHKIYPGKRPYDIRKKYGNDFLEVIFVQSTK